MGFNGKGVLIFGIRRKKPSKCILLNILDCPFDFYEILINPQNYEI